MRYKTTILMYTMLLGLIPLLWFKQGQIITGTDVNFSPFPTERLEKRLYTWDPHLLTGSPKTHNATTLPYIGTSGILAFFINNPQTVQKITFVIWMTLTGLAMAFLVEKVFGDFKEKDKIYIQLFSILLYMVNFYNIFLWVRLHITITTLVFLPVFFGVIYSIVAKNSLTSKDALALTIATILGSSIGSQPPLIYVVIMSTIVFVGYYVLQDYNNPKILVQKIKRLLLASLVIVVAGAYWILPQAFYIFTSNLTNSEFGQEIFDVEKLLGWTSSTTSNLNVLRNFGDVVWLDSWGGQFYFPEFVSFYNNTFFASLSFLLLFVVLFPFYADAKKRKSLTAFGLVMLMSLFFSKGLHPPLEKVFGFLFDTLPAFWIHRAPWQKFGMITSLCYSLLGGYGLYLITKKTGKFVNGPKATKSALFILFFTFYLIYNNLFVLGKMFPSKEDAQGYHGHYNLGFHHTFPDYIYSLKSYVEAIDKYNNYNIFLLPELKTSVYNWGYGSSVDIVSIILNKPTLYTLYGEGYFLEGYISNIYNDIFQSIYNDTIDPEDLIGVADFYNIRYILQRNDFSFEFFGDSDSPTFIKERLNRLQLQDPLVFGEWDLYEIGTKKTYPFVVEKNYFVDVSKLNKNILLPTLQIENPNTVLVGKTNMPLEFNQRYTSAELLSADSKDICQKESVCYKVDIDSQGLYTVDILESNYKNLNQTSIEIKLTGQDNQTVQPSNSDPFTYFLDQGTYFINLSIKADNKSAEIVETIKEAEVLNLLNQVVQKDVEEVTQSIESLGYADYTQYKFSPIDSLATYNLNITGPQFLVLSQDYENKIRLLNFKNLPTKVDVNETITHTVNTTSGIKFLVVVVPISNETTKNDGPITLSKVVNPNLIFSSEISTLTQESEVNKNHSLVTTRVNPTKFLVDVSGKMENTTTIVLNQTYNKNWSLYVSNGESKRKLPENRKFLANFYANGWVIYDNDISEGEYLIIEFEGQKVFYTGLAMSATSLLLVFLIALNSKFTNFKRGRWDS